MNLGQFLGNAGLAAGRIRQAEEAERVAQQNQLAIEEQNRLADLKAQMARSQYGSLQPQAAPDFGALATGGAQPTLPQAPAYPVEVIAAPSPSSGIRRMTAEEVGRLLQDPYATGRPAAPTTPAAPAAPAAAPAATPAQPVSALPTSELTAAQFQALPQAERLRRLQIENDRRRAQVVGTSLLTVPAAAADIFVGGPYNAIANLGSRAANAIGVPRIGRALGIYDPDVTSVEIPRIGAGTSTPYYDALRQQQAAAAPLTEEQFLAQLKQQDTARTQRAEAERAANAQRAEAERTKNVQAAQQQGLADWQLDNKGKPVRGLVNNNPGNIRPSAQFQWDGQVGVDKGEKERAGFVQFATPEAGIRAMTINLLSYDQQGINTVQGIINRWAPPSDQPGKSNSNYIRAVSDALGVKPTDQINLKDPVTMQKLVPAIIQFENGKQPYSAAMLATGITAGLTNQRLGATLTAGAAAPAAAAPAAAAPAPAAAAPATGITIPGISSAQAATPTATPAQQVAPARVDADFYLANPQAIPYEQQQLNRMLQQQIGLAQQQAALLTRQRNEAAQMAQMYMRSGTAQGIEAATRLQGAINQYDGSLLQVQQQVAEARQKVEQGRTYLEGMQGIQEFALANDPRRLASVWSLYAGVPIGIQPRSDGKFNIMVNGRKTKEGISATELTDSARLAFDQTYRQQQAAAGAKLKEFMTQEQFKAMLEIQKGNATEMAKMIGDIARERVKGNNAQALEWAKANYGWDIKPTGAGDGTVIIRAPGSPPYVFNPSSGATVSPDGVTIPAGGARIIPGLPTPAGQTAALPTR